MDAISIFDIFKIGIGPSSSHTMGPWKAAQTFLTLLDFENVESIIVDLYGSLSKTGYGHGTDVAVMLGLSNFDYRTIDTLKIESYIKNIKLGRKIKLGNKKLVDFVPSEHILFHSELLPFHPNGMKITAFLKNDKIIQETYYSVGGGFICTENNIDSSEAKRQLPYPINSSKDLESWIDNTDSTFIEVVRMNELSISSLEEFDRQIQTLWETMTDSVYRGCHTFGILPGGLGVERRAPILNRQLIQEDDYQNKMQWMEIIKAYNYNFKDTLKWVSCFALAVNEENAAFGRVVTAPTNGAAGVIPAVLLYHFLFNHATFQDVCNFLLVSGEVGSLFKKGATISAAMGGCQAEIGVSSAMAAAGLTGISGGNCSQILMAAEIAMEHHLGLTCDPVNGLVQIPCIERNTMGAIKAITASQIALSSNPKNAKVSLDEVIQTMWDTAQDMNLKYKETADGGLAKNVKEMIAEC